MKTKPKRGIHVNDFYDGEIESIESIAQEREISIADLIRDALNNTYPELNIKYSNKKPPRAWSKEEELFLRRYFTKYRITEFAKQMELVCGYYRQPGAIIGHATLLGLHKPKRRIKVNA